MTVGQAFAAIVHECIRQFRLNQALIIAERDPDALHQARVAMRRLRTAFRYSGRRSGRDRLAAQDELRDFLEPFGRRAISMSIWPITVTSSAGATTQAQPPNRQL